MKELVTIGTGGFLGVIMRYVISQWIKLHLGGHLPYVSLTVNVSGCFLAGLFLSIFSKRLDISNILKTIIMVGFIGSFNTFSTFGVETLNFLKLGR